MTILEEIEMIMGSDYMLEISHMGNKTQENILSDLKNYSKAFVIEKHIVAYLQYQIRYWKAMAANQAAEKGKIKIELNKIKASVS